MRLLKFPVHVPLPSSLIFKVGNLSGSGTPEGHQMEFCSYLGFGIMCAVIIVFPSILILSMLALQTFFLAMEIENPIALMYV